MPQPHTSYRLSDDAREYLSALAARMGLSRRSVLEIAIRRLSVAELTIEDQASVKNALEKRLRRARRHK